MRTLNLTHLHTFAEVIAHGSFSAAAERLGLTQPAVSLQIRQLERHFNLRLIERVAKRCKPTSAGTALLEHLARIDSAVEGALEAMNSHAQGIAGQVSIGTGATACIHLLPPMLRSLKRRFPGLDVRVSTGNTSDLIKAVEDNRLDLAVLTLPASSRRVQLTPVLEDQFVAIFAQDDPRRPDSLTPETLVDLPMVMFETGSSTRQLIDDWFLQAGLVLKPVMELGSIEAIKEMVAAGLGCSVVPRMAVAASHHRRGLEVHALSPDLGRTLAMALRQDKPLGKALQQVIQAILALGPKGPGS